MRRCLAPLLTGVLLATSVAVPLMDRMPDSRLPALETEHHPSTCHVGHDHRICTLVGANLWLGSTATPTPAGLLRFRTVLPAAVTWARSSRSHSSHRSRAPPVV